jgi:hypothetical protein
MVALDYFRRLGHDNHRRLSKLYAWEERKSKTSWGAQTVDFEKIAATAVQDMKTADVQRFLVVCALVPDLYCPGYNPRQPLAKDSNLATTAGRHKIDSQDAPRHHHEEFAHKPLAQSSTLSQSEHDWAYAKRALARGDDPEEVIRRITDYRADDKHDPAYYARHTVLKAQADIQRTLSDRKGACRQTGEEINQGPTKANWHESEADHQQHE